MGSIHAHRPVLLIAAVTSKFPKAFEWGLAEAEKEWGPVRLLSDRFDFRETNYYEASMGTELYKQFWAFETLLDPGKVPATKIFSNRLEETFAQENDYSVERPINIDPGYLTEAKLVLATTKDRDHRIYLNDGIYAEVTLYYHRGEWKSRPWTYPDYQRDDFQAFFTDCRNHLRERYRQFDRESKEAETN